MNDQLAQLVQLEAAANGLLGPPDTSEGEAEGSTGADVGAVATEDGLTKRLADEILNDSCFAKDAGGRLFVFQHGAYRPHGEEWIKRRVLDLLVASQTAKQWSTHRASEVTEFLRVLAPRLWERPPLETLNVVNGDRKSVV